MHDNSTIMYKGLKIAVIKYESLDYNRKTIRCVHKSTSLSDKDRNECSTRFQNTNKNNS